MRRAAALATCLVWLAPALAACVSGPPPVPGPDTSKGEIKIASDLPVTGADGVAGRPAELGARFAVERAGALKGFKLSFAGFDDAVNGSHDVQKGVENVQAMLSDPKVLGLVGPFNSNVARAQIPVANPQSLAMVSPANIDDCLTMALAYCQPKPADLRPGGPNNYFRVAAADAFQGPAMADFAFDTLRVSKAAVFSDDETFGKESADGFAAELKRRGGSVVVRQDFDMSAVSDFTPFLKAAHDAGAQAVYAGATSATHGCVPRAQAKGILATDVYYLGTDAIADSTCLAQAGDQVSDHMYASSGIPDATQNPDARAVVDAYRKAHPSPDDLGSYTFPAYDCAEILIDAIGRAIDAAGGRAPTRRQVLDALASSPGLKLTGGSYAFDAQGDPKSPVLSYYQAKGSDWAFARQTAFSPAG